MMIKGHDLGLLLKRTWKEIGADKIGVYAAQMAYAFFFSLFPLLLVIAALLSLVGDQGTIQGWFDSRMAAALPKEVASLLGTTIQKVVFAKGAPGLLSFGLLTAAWAGSGVFGALREALNTAYDVNETRPRWKQYALQLGMLAVSAVVVLLASVILVNGEGVMAWIGDHVGLSRITTLVWTVAQFPLAIGALVGVMYMIFMYLPNCRHQSPKVVLLGSVLATILWIAATLLFRLYIQKFNRLNPAYGTIGAIMILLTWMYYSAFAILAVGELNSEIESEGAEARQGVPKERAVARVTTASARGGGVASDGTHDGRVAAASSAGMGKRLISALGMAAVAGLAARLVGKKRDEGEG